MLDVKNNRRSFLKQGALLTLGGFAAAKLLAQETPVRTMEFIPGNYRTSVDPTGLFKQDALRYKYNELMPFIDEVTMETHYSKHHAGYVRKLNSAISAYKGEKITNLELIFPRISTFPNAIRNNGGGHYNHNLFWKTMHPGGTPMGEEVKVLLKETFGSVETFKEQFSQTALTRFGSGWAWLVVTPEKSLAITSTANQDNPLMDVSEVKGVPILGLDVWEHAYYLKYKNNRAEYIKNWWSVVNWEMVDELYREERG